MENQNKEEREFKEINIEIGKRFAEFRKMKKLSQRDISDAIEVTRAYITQVETGRVNPSYKIMYHMCKNYNLSIDWLLLGRGEMEIQEDNILEHMTEAHYEFIRKFLQLEEKKQHRFLGGFNQIIDED